MTKATVKTILNGTADVTHNEVFGAQAIQGLFDYISGNPFDEFQAKEEGYVWGWEQGEHFEW